jgi:hypothetical protein
MPINSFLYPAPSTPTFAYNVANSCRFDDGSNCQMRRASVDGGDQDKFTLSMWIKRGVITTSFPRLFTSRASSDDRFEIYFGSNDSLYIEGVDNGTATLMLNTNRKFRDPSAWFHFLLAVDTDQSTASNRAKLWINGVQETSFATETYPSQDGNIGINTSSFPIRIAEEDANGVDFDGYLTEIVFLDGVQKTNTDFGEFDSDSPNIWKPIDVSGLSSEKGNNGFYLDFEDSSNLGNDGFGGTDFSVSNLAATDQSTDTCTNNFATLNPLLDVNATPTFTEGNLVFQGTGSTNFVGATIPVSSGKWYVEVKATTVNGSYPIIGVIDAQSYKRRDSTYFVGSDINTDNPSGFAVFSNGDIYHNGDNNFSNLTTTYTSGDIIGMALNMDASPNTLGFYKNGALEVTINLDTAPSGAYMFSSSIHSSTSSAKGEFNFGNPTFTISSGNADGNGYGNFEYAVPSGYYALNTKNLAEYG